MEKLTIANPIYDTVFKYLLEDLDIAKGLLSAILDVEITELTMQPQETIGESAEISKAIRVYRIDFAAIIKQADGQVKKVLIELQKTKRNTNITRFRRYLGENYQREDSILEDGKSVKQPLEIITIYLLGFPLNKIPTAIVHSKPHFRDIINGTDADYAYLEEFVKLLTHESYFIQIPKLIEPTKTRVERVLSIFNQTFKSHDEHSLYYELQEDDPLLQKMLSRLTRAIADDTMRRKMNIEDEIEREFSDYQEKLEAKEQALTATKQVLSETKQVLEQKAQELEESKKEIEALKRLLDDKNNQ